MKRKCTNSDCRFEVADVKEIACPKCKTILPAVSDDSKEFTHEQEAKISERVATILDNSTVFKKHIIKGLINRAMAVIGVALLFIGGSYIEGIRIVNEKVDARLMQLDNETSNKIAAVQFSIETNILAQFKDPRIKETVSTVAANQASNLLTQQIAPEIESFRVGTSNTLSQFDNSLKEFQMQSTNSIAQVNDILDIAIKIISALNDDRSAFFQIYKLALTGTNKYGLLLNNTLSTIILREVQSSSPFNQVQLNWKQMNFNPDTNSWEDYISLFNKSDSITRTALLQKISEQDRFPRDKKLHLYSEMLELNNSLMILVKTCSIIDNEAKIGLLFTEKERYNDWVKSQWLEFSLSSCSNSIATNKLDIEAFCLQGYLFSAVSNYIDSAKDYKMAVSINPTNCDALNAYAWLLSTCIDDKIRNGEQAVGLAQKACALSKWRQWNFVGTLAAAYAECGNYDLAVKYINQAINMDGIDEESKTAEKRRLILYLEHKPAHESVKLRLFK